jgi:hypothetical protein
MIGKRLRNGYFPDFSDTYKKGKAGRPVHSLWENHVHKRQPVFHVQYTTENGERLPRRKLWPVVENGD